MNAWYMIGGLPDQHLRLRVPDQVANRDKQEEVHNPAK
jgi:hypothetical protein